MQGPLVLQRETWQPPQSGLQILSNSANQCSLLPPHLLSGHKFLNLVSVWLKTETAIFKLSVKEKMAAVR